ncbi:MAG: fimbrillin family protein [Muribaculaceae bacterium]|nr:fimbrillin family protein [Muribaculaceae bacterium]
MNILYKYILYAVVVLSLCAGVVSCSQDELGIRSDEMPPGEYPLKLKASVDGMRTRADEHCSWVDGDSIAVRIGVIGRFDRIGNYMLNADGTVMDEPTPLSWPRPKDIVKAWYPYVDMNDVKTCSLKDQSRGYHHIDFMRAETDSIHFKDVVNLTFKHEMAKISTELVRGDGISEEEFATAKVYYNGYTGVNFSETDFNSDGFDIGLITPDSVNAALLVPREMTGQPLITVTLTVNVNGNLIDKTLTYTASSADNLKAGYHNRYTVTIQKDRLDVNPPVTASWNDDKEPGASQPWIFKVAFDKNLNIPESRRKDLAFSDNVVNEEDFKQNRIDTLYVAGNDFSISCTMKEEKRPKLNLMDAAEGIDDMTSGFEVDTTHNSVTFNFDFHLRSNLVTLAYKEFFGYEDPEVGSFYYDDGTWSRNLNKNKTCIGIVFDVLENKEWWNEEGIREALKNRNDDGDYDLKEFKDGFVHGYVVALKDVQVGGSYQFAWMRDPNDPNNYKKLIDCGTGPYNNSKNDNPKYYNGYSNLAIIESIKQMPNNPYEFPAFDACRAYNETAKAPDCTSGWYLPSYDQYKCIGDYEMKQVIYAKFGVEGCGGEQFQLWRSGTSTAALNTHYWTSSEATNANANYVYFSNNTTSRVFSSNQKTNARRVRTILTF